MAIASLHTEYAAPKQQNTVNVVSAKVVLLDNGCRPNVTSKRTEFIATMRVAPSCNSTANHSGNAPKRAGIADPKIDTTASAMFCRKMRRVRSAMENSSGN